MTRNQKNSLLKEAYYNLEQRYYKKISRKCFLTIAIIFTAIEAMLIYQAAPITAMKVISVIATVFCILAIAWYFASLFVEKQYLKTVGECINDGLCDIKEKETDIIITLDGDIIYTKGIRSEQLITTGKICGFRKFDKIKYFGKEYFIKGRMSTGYAILMDIDGNKIDFSAMPKGCKIPKLSNCRRVASRKTILCMQVAA